MKATVMQFRRGRQTYTPKHFILNVGAKNKEEARKFIGKEVEYICTGKKKKTIKGKISSSHGNKGMVRAIFEKGLPGQAINCEVEVK